MIGDADHDVGGARGGTPTGGAARGRVDGGGVGRCGKVRVGARVMGPAQVVGPGVQEGGSSKHG